MYISLTLFCVINMFARASKDTLYEAGAVLQVPTKRRERSLSKRATKRQFNLSPYPNCVQKERDGDEKIWNEEDTLSSGIHRTIQLGSRADPRQFRRPRQQSRCNR